MRYPIGDEPQQRRWPPIPCARMGCRGTAPSAALSLLDDVLKTSPTSRRLAFGAVALATRPTGVFQQPAGRADGPGPPWPGKAASKDGAGPGVLHTAAGLRSCMGSLLGPHPYVRTPPGAGGSRRMALLASLGRRQAHSLPAVGRWGSGPSRISGATPAGRDAMQGAARKAMRAGRCIGDEPQRRSAPCPRRPPVGAGPGGFFVGPARRVFRFTRLRRAVANPFRPRGQRAESPWEAGAPPLLGRRHARGRALFPDRP